MQQKSLLVQLSLLLLALAILVGGGMYFYGQYTETNESVNKLITENRTLENRIEVLSSASQELSRYVNIAYQTIPESNGGLLAMNTIQGLKDQEEVGINGVYVKSSFLEKQNTSKYDVDFEVQGEVEKVLVFVQKISSSLPLLRLLELDTKVIDNQFATATISMEVLSKALPEELPALKEALSPLSDSDKLLLSQLENYFTPVIPQPVEDNREAGEDNREVGRGNPFSSFTTSEITTPTTE